MPTAYFRFYAELNDFLLPHNKYKNNVCKYYGRQSVKHLIESMGIPHTEIDLIIINGSSVDFSYLVKDGDQVSVYPVFETMDIASINHLRPAPLREVKFVLDVHLGRLAAYLRMLGLDAVYRNDYDDDELADLSSAEKRILLTHDRGLLKRKQVTHGFYIRSANVRQQMLEVLKRFDLLTSIRPFSRCLRCNDTLQDTSKEEITDQLLPGTRKNFHEFKVCPTCEQIYWKGAHYQHMQNLVDGWVKELTGNAKGEIKRV